MKIKMKRVFNLYNIGIIMAIILIITSLFLIFDVQNLFTNNQQIVQNAKEENITEENARKMAKKQFEKLGEHKIDKNKLQVVEIKRGEEKYYYISSSKNTMEIRIKDGRVTRINSVLVEE